MICKYGQDDHELVDRWHSDNDQEAYSQLQDRHKGMVHQFVNKYEAANVPKPALEGKAWSKFDDAVQSYDKDKGAAFPTHLHYNLRKLDRFTKKHQNIGRIPEAKAGKIGDLQRATQELEYKHNRKPEAGELADELGWEPDDVEELQNLQRQDLYEGKFPGETLQDDDLHERADWLLGELSDELEGREKEIYNRLTDDEDVTTQQLAQEFDVSPGRISQIKKSIGTQLKPHLSRHL